MSRLLIFGCGGHARSVADIYLRQFPQGELIFIDANGNPGEKILGFPVAHEVPANSPDDNLFFGVGDNRIRKLNFEQYPQFNIATIISSSAYLGAGSKIKEGCFIGNFCHIGPDAYVGENTIINNGSIIEHEVRIGKHCHIAPNATVSGRSQLGDEVFVGAGAVIIDKISVCSYVIIGAGSTVVNSIKVPGTYVGSPARLVSAK